MRWLLRVFSSNSRTERQGGSKDGRVWGPCCLERRCVRDLVQLQVVLNLVWSWAGRNCLMFETVEGCL